MNYLLEFFLGGTIIVGISYLATNVTPKYAALLYGVPIQFVIAIIVIYLNGKNILIEQVIKESLYYTITLASFLLLFYILNKNFDFYLSLFLSLLYLLIINIVVFYIS